MKKLIFVFVLSLLASPLYAQSGTPIVVGPSTVLVWEDPGLTAPLAQACTHAIATSVSGPFTPLVGPVTCTAPVAPATAPTCSVNLLAQGTAIPIGSGSIVMTATCSGTTSLPSAPLAYLDVVVPIPQNLRLK